MLALGSLCTTTLSSTLVLLGDVEKKPENPNRSEKNWFTNGMWDVTCCMMKAEEEERWIFKKLKRQKSWEVRGLKELKKVNSFNGWSYAGTVAEWKCLHKKDWEKCFPNSCHFWKQCNGYWQNIYILSHKGHCWTLWCFFFFLSVLSEK